MGYWYWRQLKREWVVDESATNRFDLPERGALSALCCQVETRNEADLGNYVNAFPVERTSLRIVGNGNYEIINAHGRQIHAMNFIDTGKLPKEELSTVDNDYQEQWFYLNFGRYLGDMKYGIHLDKFGAGVQFEETNTFETTYYQNNYSNYTIYGLFRKNPEANLFSGGYLRKRQIINKDAASETQYAVKLPTEAKLRQIHLFAIPDCTSGVMSTTCFNVIYRIWLSIKSKEEYIIENMPSDHWGRYIHDYLGRSAETSVKIQAYTQGAYHDTMIDESKCAVMTGMYPGTAHFWVSDTGTDTTRYQRAYNYLHDGSANTNMIGMIRKVGILLHGNMPLLTTDPKADEVDFLDAKANKDVYVEVTENSSAGNWYIVLDELEKAYPT